MQAQNFLEENASLMGVRYIQLIKIPAICLVTGGWFYRLKSISSMAIFSNKNISKQIFFQYFCLSE